MGCASSTPVKEEEKGTGAKADVAVDEGKTQKLAAPAPVSSTRARRLSNVVVQNADGSQPNGVPLPPITGNSKDTRARRLSYITNDPNSMRVLEAEGGQGDPSEGPVPIAVQPGSSNGPPLKLQVACMSRAGKEPGFKKTNQDNCFAFEKYITEDQCLFGAMDGHGPHGHLVSGFVKQHLPIILVNHLTSEGKSVEDALTSGFLEVDKGLSNSRIDCEFSGSTCVVAYIKGRTLTTAWVGDSRGVIGYDAGKGIQALDLTNDHKPTIPEEKTRILNSNGRVEKLVDEVGQPMGPHRVWLQYAWIPGLAMSRALGDVLAHQVGVSSEPEHTVLDLDPTHKFMILASDGVWEFITSKEAVDIVAQYETIEEACRHLVDEAYQRWLIEEDGVVDDITAVIVWFKHEVEENKQHV